MAKNKWNLRSIFFEDDPAAPKSAAKRGGAQPTPKKLSPAPASAPPSPATSTSTPLSTTGEVSNRFVKVLMAAMEAVNLPGFDYLEYKKSLQNLKKMNFTDEVRYQTAYAAAQSMGVTPAKLSETAQHYLNTLAKEEAKFSQALAGQQAQQVGAKREQLKKYDATIARQEAKIKELQASIEQNKAKQEQLRESIEQSNAKLQKTKADFETTYSVLTEGIRKDVAAMKKYLK